MTDIPTLPETIRVLTLNAQPCLLAAAAEPAA
jgi:hypothetical protein